MFPEAPPSTIPETHRPHVHGTSAVGAVVEEFFALRARTLATTGRMRLGEPSRRSADSHCRDEWRVVAHRVTSDSNHALTLFHGRPLVIDDGTARHLEGAVNSYFEHFPEEPTRARDHGVPVLYGRLDVLFGADGTMKIAEIDDQASYVSLLKYLNPVADSWFVALEKQLDDAGTPLRLVEQTDTFAGTPRGYHHTDADWLPRLMPWDDLSTSVVARSRRWMPGFRPFNDAWESRNILSGRYRDYKGVLAPMGLAVLISDIDVAIEASRHILRALRTEGVGRNECAVILKGVYSARCEQVWAAALGERGRGMQGLESIRRRVGEIEALSNSRERLHILMQDYQRPVTAAGLGLFDEEVVRATERLADGRPRTAPTGRPHLLDAPPSVTDAERFHVLGRVFFVCLSDADGSSRTTVVGGIAQARTTPTRIHGANDTATFALVRDDLVACPLVTPDDIARFRGPRRTTMTNEQSGAYEAWDRLPPGEWRPTRPAA